MKKQYRNPLVQKILESTFMRKINEHIADYSNNYSESNFWEKLHRVATKVGKQLLSVVLSLYYVLVSGNVSVKHKTLIIGALGYFILPIDLLPDAIAGIGYADDLTALLTVYNAVKCNITPDISMQVENKLKEWRLMNRKSEE